MNRRVRVLWLIKGLGAGGAEQLLVTAARVRDRSRFDYEVAYLLPWKNHHVPTFEGLEVPVHCLDVRDERNIAWAGKLRRLLSSGHYDVLHLHSPYVAGVARLVVHTLPEGARPVLMSTEHNIWSSFSMPTRLLNACTSPLDQVRLAVSDTVRASTGGGSSSVEVVVHGVDVAAVEGATAKREETRRSLGVEAEEVVIGTVGNFRAQKGYPDLLAAARQVLDSGLDVQFVAIGHGPLESEIRQRHADLRLGERFRFLGSHANPPEVMAGFDIFTLASEYEGLSVALMEAMVLGLPVVATDVQGISQAVTHGVEGILSPPHEPDSLAAGLSELAGNPVQRARMGRAAAIRGCMFDIRRAVREIEARYVDVA